MDGLQVAVLLAASFLAIRSLLALMADHRARFRQQHAAQVTAQISAQLGAAQLAAKDQEAAVAAVANKSSAGKNTTTSPPVRKAG